VKSWAEPIIQRWEVDRKWSGIGGARWGGSARIHRLEPPKLSHTRVILEGHLFCGLAFQRLSAGVEKRDVQEQLDDEIPISFLLIGEIIIVGNSSMMKSSFLFSSSVSLSFVVLFLKGLCKCNLANDLLVVCYRYLCVTWLFSGYKAALEPKSLGEFMKVDKFDSSH